MGSFEETVNLLMVDIGNPHSDNFSQCRQGDHRMLDRIVVILFEDVAERSTRDSMGNGSIHRPKKRSIFPLNQAVRRGAAIQLMFKERHTCSRLAE